MRSKKKNRKNGLGSSVAGGVGFEPTTTDLGGRCSVQNEGLTRHDHPLVRAELPAHPSVQHE